MAEIDNLIAEVNKKYKTDIIRKASDLKGIEFIPYTSPMMNYLTRGGVPVGRIMRSLLVLTGQADSRYQKNISRLWV